MATLHFAASINNDRSSGEALLLLSSATSSPTPVITDLIVVLRDILMKGASIATSGALLKALVIHGAINLLGSMEIPAL